MSVRGLLGRGRVVRIRRVRPDQLLAGVIAPSGLSGIPGRVSRALVQAHQVAPEWHVRVQSAFQAHTDNAVSKTVNLPANASPGEVERVFRLAYDLECKGIAVYRDGSRAGQTLSSVAGHNPLPIPQETNPRPRARVTRGTTTKFHIGCGTLFITVNRDENGLCEVVANLGKAGGCPSQSEATIRGHRRAAPIPR